MGCGASKDKLSQVEKPLEHWVEPLEMQGLDETFSSASNLIKTIEEKRSAIVDELESVYAKSGAIAFKKRDLNKALRCTIWKLGVDNGGKVDEIGINVESQLFERSNNSEEGNIAGNSLIYYCKNLLENWKIEDLTSILNELEEINKNLSENHERYMNIITENCKENPFDGFKKNSKIKGNRNKCENAISCLKQVIEILKNLALSAPDVLASLNPERIVKESIHVEKAFNKKLNNPVEIAWNLIENPKERNGKKWDDCLKDHEDKLKLKKALLDKLQK